jgi:hypothetical protein
VLAAVPLGALTYFYARIFRQTAAEPLDKYPLVLAYTVTSGANSGAKLSPRGDQSGEAKLERSMRLNLPGSILPFADVLPGSLFGYFPGGDFGLAMRVHVPNLAQATVLVFNKSRMPFLEVTTSEKFSKRDVIVLKDPVLRPVGQLQDFRDSAWVETHIGDVIAAQNDTAYFRTLVPTFGQVDVNLESGAGIIAKQHPGSVIIKKWQIVVPASPDDLTVFDHDPSVVA